MAPKSKNQTATSDKTQPLRFAHPFYTNVPPAKRTVHSVHGQRMTDFIQGKLTPIPAVKGDSRFTLADVIGQQGSDGIAAAGKITIHIAGDTGVPEGNTETKQVMVADAMTRDYDPINPHTSPAFFLHVGDVIYGADPTAYQSEFYRPYVHYPGKIVAIPGNHDGESTTKIADFQKYFCAPTQAVPPIAGTIFRETMNQPGVYWCLDAPFVQIVGMYSNSAENPGYISGPAIGQAQKQWLVKTLTALKAARTAGPRKALLFVTHHPPYSSGGHSGSAQMLADIDDACKQAGIMPDAFFSGHAHSIQRYTRTVSFNGQTLKIPYIVTGCGGHGGQVVAAPSNNSSNNPMYEFGYKGWGYTKVVIDPKSMVITSYGVVDDTTTNELDVPVMVSLA